MRGSVLSNSIMNAAVFHGNDRITIERVAMPEPAAGEVLVRVSRTALCGSDFKLWHKGAEFTAGHANFWVGEEPRRPLQMQRCPGYIALQCLPFGACPRSADPVCVDVSSPVRP